MRKYKNSWFKRKVGNDIFVAGGKSYQRYELDYGKISFVLIILGILSFIVYIFW